MSPCPIILLLQVLLCQARRQEEALSTIPLGSFESCLSVSVCAPFRFIFLSPGRCWLVCSSVSVFRCSCPHQYFATSQKMRGTVQRSPTGPGAQGPIPACFLINALGTSYNVFWSYSSSLSPSQLLPDLFLPVRAIHWVMNDLTGNRTQIQMGCLYYIPFQGSEIIMEEGAERSWEPQVRENRSGNNVFWTWQCCCTHEPKAAVVGFTRSRTSMRFHGVGMSSWAPSVTWWLLGKRAHLYFLYLGPRTYLPLTIVHWKERLIKTESLIFLLV